MSSSRLSSFLWIAIMCVVINIYSSDIFEILHGNASFNTMYLLPANKGGWSLSNNNQTIIKQQSSNNQTSCVRNYHYFQTYHISKCGGTYMRVVLREIFNLTPPSAQHKEWHLHGSNMWKGEFENEDDQRYKRNPNHPEKRKTFILGLVRNPFSYYRSLWHMLISDNTLREEKEYLRTNGTSGSKVLGQCEYKLAHRYQKPYIFTSGDAHLRSNVSAFHDFVSLILQHGGECGAKIFDPRMQQRHDNTMVMNDGSMAYDAVVMQERYYTTLRTALEMFDRCSFMPNITRLNVLDKLEKENNVPNNRKNLMYGAASKAKQFPDYCFYSPELRAMVEKNDAEMMQRYNYTWDTFVGNGSPSIDCAGLAGP